MRNRSYLTVGISLCLLAAAPCTLLPMLQEPGDYHIRSETRVVEIDIQVRDAKGKPVRGLKAEDFTVLDNGKPRPFTIFHEYGAETDAPPATQTEAPQSDKPSPALPPNTFTNLGPPKQPNGHSTVLLLDGVNGWFDNFAFTRKGVTDMLGRIPADEKIAVYVIVKQMGLAMLQDYTTDHARILAALDHFIPQGMRPSPLYPIIDIGMQAPVPAAGIPAPSRASSSDADASLGARKAAMASAIDKNDDLQRASEQVRLSLKALAAQLAGQSGRKSVFWFTQGLSPLVIWGDGTNNTMDKAWQETISSLNNANIAVNTIDNNGLLGPQRLWGKGTVLMQKQLAEETGGTSYYNRNDLGVAAAEGIVDSRSGYALAFYLTKTDGEYHTLKVRVDKPGLNLNYRQGYASTDDSLPDAAKGKGVELETLLMNPSNVSGVGITANLTAVPGNPRGTLNVSLNLTSASLSLLKGPQGWTGQVDEMFIEFNAAGREVGRASGTGRFNVPSDAREAFDSEGATVTQRLRLPADAVKLAIIVRDTSSGRVGSLSVPIDTTTHQ